MKRLPTPVVRTRGQRFRLTRGRGLIVAVVREAPVLTSPDGVVGTARDGAYSSQRSGTRMSPVPVLPCRTPGPLLTRSVIQTSLPMYITLG